MECFGPLAIIVIVATYLLYRQRANAWQKFADNTGLGVIYTFVIPKGVEGLYRGRGMKLYTYQDSNEVLRFRAEVNVRKRPTKFPLGKSVILKYAPPSFRPVLSELHPINFKLDKNKMIFEVKGLFDVDPFWGGADNLINLVNTLSSVADAIEAVSSKKDNE